MSFSDAANPEFFKKDPRKFWFFYGHRYKFNLSDDLNVIQLKNAGVNNLC